MSELPLMWRIRARWYSACILAFWYDDTKVGEYTSKLANAVEIGTHAMRSKESNT